MAGTCAMSSDRVLPPAYSLPQVLIGCRRARSGSTRPPGNVGRQRGAAASLAGAHQGEGGAARRSARRRSYASAGDAAEVERLDGEFAASALTWTGWTVSVRRNTVRANTEQIVCRLNNFIMQGSAVPSSRCAAATDQRAGGRRQGEASADAILRVRREIAVAQGELMRVKTAPPPRGGDQSGSSRRSTGWLGRAILRS